MPKDFSDLLYSALAKTNEIDQLVESHKNSLDQTKLNEINKNLEECKEEVDENVKNYKYSEMKALAEKVELALEASRNKAELLTSNENKEVSDSNKKIIDSKIDEAHLIEADISVIKTHYFFPDSTDVIPNTDTPPYGSDDGE